MRPTSVSFVAQSMPEFSNNGGNYLVVMFVMYSLQDFIN